jgi:hypothetical protein
VRTPDCDGSESGSLACLIKRTAFEFQKLDGAPNCNKLSVFPGCDPEQTYEEDLSSDQDVTMNTDGDTTFDTTIDDIPGKNDETSENTNNPTEIIDETAGGNPTENINDDTNDISNDIFGNELKCEDLFKLYQPGEETYSTNLDSRGQHNATYRFETASLGSDF